MGDPIKTTDGLKAGDVVMVAKKITPRDGSDAYWWRTFRVVMWVIGQTVDLLILRMHVDLDKDTEYVEVTDSRYVITLVAEDQQPQGVRAMWMKHVHKGLIKLGDEG